jgi:catechol 2,3-dioxygenase-like lactoylglutathione lyase family enzyme
MAQIRTFDHCGFVVEDIPRSHQFYNALLGAKPLHIQNLNTQRLYQGGFPIMSFVEMGGHRFELCLAQEPLPDRQTGTGMPRIGFSLTNQVMDELIKQLEENQIPHQGPISYPGAVPFKRTIRVWDPDGNTLEFCVRR